MRKGLSLRVALAAASLIAASPGPAAAQTAEEPLVLKGQSSFPAAANFHLLFVHWAESVEKMSGGSVKIETLPAGAIVPAFEVFDAVSRGVLDVGNSPFGFILGKSLAGIPLSHGPLFGMDGMDYWAWYYDGGGMAAAGGVLPRRPQAEPRGLPGAHRLPAGPRLVQGIRSRAWTISRA